MVETEIISFEIEPAEKAELESIFSQNGLTVTEAVDMFFKKTMKRKKLPFTTRKAKLTKEWREIIAEAKDFEQNPHKYKRFSDFDEFLKDLYDGDEA